MAYPSSELAGRYGKDLRREREDRCDRLFVVGVMWVALNGLSFNDEVGRRRGPAFNDVGLHYLVMKSLAFLVPKSP